MSQALAEPQNHILDQYDRVPPQAVDVERAILGAMLLDKEAIFRATRVLDDGCFYSETHRRLWAAITHLHDMGVAVDQITLAEELRRWGRLEECGGVLYLAQLTTEVATSANIEYHAKIILEKSNLRKLIMASQQTVARCYEGIENSLEIRAGAEGQFQEVRDTRTPWVGPEEFMAQKDRILSKQEIEPTGIQSLDAIMQGCAREDFVIIAGATSMGKTALMCNIARNLGVRGVPVGIISLEMSTRALLQRLIALEGRIPFQDIPGQPDTPFVESILMELAGYSLWVSDSGGNLNSIVADAEMLLKQKGLRVLIVDYLQLIPVRGRYDTREQQVAAISRQMKALARERGITVIGLSQLHRLTHTDEPKLSDLRESGALEQDADKVVLLWRPEYYGHEVIEGVNRLGQMKINVAKNRNGPTDYCWLKWRADIMRLSELEGEARAKKNGHIRKAWQE